MFTSEMFPSDMFTNEISEFGSKLYRPSDSNDIDTSFSFSVNKIKAIKDSKGGIVAPLNNFTDADTNLTGLTFDGSSNYIDLTANSINVGGDETIGNGFSFETYVQPSQVAEDRTIMVLGNDDNNKLDFIKMLIKNLYRLKKTPS